MHLKKSLLSKELEEKRKILETIGVKVATIDAERTVIQISPQLQILFFDEQSSKKCFEVFGEEECECTQCPLKDGKVRKKIIERKGRHFEYTAFPVKNKEGQITLAFATFLEITDRVLMEQALEKCNQELRRKRGENQ